MVHSPKIKKAFIAFLCMVALTPTSAQAKGEVSIDYLNGDTNTYTDVEIHNTDEILYLKSPDINTILMISKNECGKEGELLVCNKARIGLDTQGVLEELRVREIHLFINTSSSAQKIQGSEVTLSPGTILLEAVTEKGSYINALGTIDSTKKPVGASR
jgi:hypothetical protein